MAIVITDGHSARNPRAMASRLQSENVTVFAVSMTPRPNVDESELLVIAREKSRVFTPENLQTFETEFAKFVGFGCPGIDLGNNSSEYRLLLELFYFVTYRVDTYVKICGKSKNTPSHTV